MRDVETHQQRETVLRAFLRRGAANMRLLRRSQRVRDKRHRLLEQRRLAGHHGVVRCLRSRATGTQFGSRPVVTMKTGLAPEANTVFTRG